MSLDLHAASAEERISAYRNVHDVWGGGLSLDQHVERRLKSAQHNRADWYVGCVDGRVAVSLGCYPLQFHLHGQQIAGFAIGSVHTHPDFRRRGHAAELIRWVEGARREQGERLALLYSDIDCNYYARLGYLECPAWEGKTSANSAAALGHQANWRLERIDGAASSDDLMRRYENYHGRLPLAVARPHEYWHFTLAKQPHDDFFYLRDRNSKVRGYARLTPRDDHLRIADYALDDDDDALSEALLAGTIQLARERQLARVATWLPDWPAASKFFEVRQRPQEITMVKPLDDGIAIDDDALAAAHHFCEIDHV